jgi:hypothetical protein
MKSDGEQYFFPRASKQEPIFGADWGTGEDLFLHFSVNDTGVGLTSSEMKNLFLRFSQASPKTHVTYGGSYITITIEHLQELTNYRFRFGLVHLQRTGRAPRWSNWSIVCTRQRK